ncbi:MAG: HlyD family efflux transporter periplasmic adaptor subunit, partial [Planctomycetes bacterium]|nr:HlyD family efflux transporter periplasmic adaptor subunit [Planctomycetota bacterium]
MKRSTKILLFLAASLVGAVTWKALQPAPPTLVVTTRVEKLAKLRSVVTASGEIRAKEFVDIQAEVAGVIQELKVREGDSVRVGDELLRLEDLQLKAEEASARAQVGAAEADVTNSEVGVQTAEASLAAEKQALANARLEREQSATSAERAKASFARKQELHQKQLIGSEEFEVSAAEARLAEQRLQWSSARIVQSEAGVTVAETRVAAAKAGLLAARQRLESTRAGLARASDMAGKTVLRAPLSGLITKLNVEKGERAVPGIQSNPIATLMTIADMSVIEAEIRVAEADIVEVAIGAPAEVEVEAMRDVKLVGKVTEIGQSPIQEATTSSQNQQSKEFKVVVRLIDPPATLRPGFTANARITTAERSDVLVVPFQAQTARELEFDEKGAYVPPPEPKEGDKERVLTAAERQRRKETKGVFVRRDGRARFLPVTFGVIGETQDVEV